MISHSSAELEAAGNTHLPGCGVAAIDRAARRLDIEGGGAIGYSTLVLATGAAAVRLSDDRMVPAVLVVMAVGIRPEVALARAAGLDVGRGIRVDDAMRMSDPAILAAGECIEHRSECIGLVAAARAHAMVAAATAGGEAVLFGATQDAAWYMRLIREAAPLGALRACLAFGPGYAEEAA